MKIGDAPRVVDYDQAVDRRTVVDRQAPQLDALASASTWNHKAAAEPGRHTPPMTIFRPLAREEVEATVRLSPLAPSRPAHPARRMLMVRMSSCAIVTVCIARVKLSLADQAAEPHRGFGRP